MTTADEIGRMGVKQEPINKIAALFRRVGWSAKQHSRPALFWSFGLY